MSTFTSAVVNQSSRTANGMRAFKSTTSALVDFFYNAGASRGKDIIPTFVASYVENSELTLRITQWLRDIRGGAGERELTKQILNWLEINDKENCKRILKKIPELGRWDDGFCLKTPEMLEFYFIMVGDSLKSGVKSKELLSKIDTLTEDQCNKILNSL